MQFKFTRPRQTFTFKPLFSNEGSWMIGFTSSEVYNSIFNITEENNKLELYTHPLDDEFSYTPMKENIAEVLHLSDISPEDLQHKIHAPDIIRTYRKLTIEKRD